MTLIEDDLKQESKGLLIFFIICYAFAIIYPLVFQIIFDSISGLIFVEVFFGGIGTFSLFGFIYTSKYKVSISQKTIIIKTLFKKIELNISDIEKYIYERYNKKIILYVFKLIVTNKKKILITRYKDEFIEILTQNNIDRVFD